MKHYSLSPPKQPLAKTAVSQTKFPYLAALRPHQWTKNLFVFAPPLFAFSLTWQSFLSISLALILFCCASSGFYLLNDIADVRSDRRHPVKCKRPIAAGLVSIPAAIAMAVVLLASALIFGWLQSPALGATLVAYALVQVAYNLILKHKPITDILSIATGFILRACAGAAATEVALSSWFLLCTAMLALFLVIEKRKAELRLIEAQGGKKTRAVLRRYSLPLLARMESVVTTGMVMSYALWSSGPLLGGASTPWMLLTLPFVLYGIFRYQLLSDPEEMLRRSSQGFAESTERPEDILLKDLPILLTVVGWVSLSFLILFLDHNAVIG